MVRLLFALVALVLTVAPAGGDRAAADERSRKLRDRRVPRDRPRRDRQPDRGQPGTAGATLTAAERARLGGMGVLLPAILIATLLGVIALLLARRRSAGR